MTASLAVPGPADELLVERNGVSLCMLVNHRARSVRVIDFRSGVSKHKRAEIMRLASAQGLERIYALVEREEVSTWGKLGFRREGTIPGFYKRGDAYVVGAAVEKPEDDSQQSGVHRIYVKSDPAEADSVYQNARRLVRDRAELPKPTVRVRQADDSDFRRALAHDLRGRRALTGLERFGRDTERYHFVCTSRGTGPVFISVESQACFNNALIELLVAPRTSKECQLMAESLDRVCEALLARDIIGCFALSPAEDSDLASIYLEAGFRRTGLLQQHLLVGERRADALLWSRKLALPGAD